MHVDGNRANWARDNLRAATRSEVSASASRSVRSTDHRTKIELVNETTKEPLTFHTRAEFIEYFKLDRYQSLFDIEAGKRHGDYVITSVESKKSDSSKRRRAVIFDGRRFESIMACAEHICSEMPGRSKEKAYRSLMAALIRKNDTHLGKSLCYAPEEVST
jgi:hypothetical protein